MNQLVILGAGIHAAIILDVCFDAGITVRGLLDDEIEDGTRVLGVPVIGGFNAIDDPEFVSSFDFIVGIGGSQDGRRKWSSAVLARGGRLRTVAHPSSVVSRFSTIGDGCFLWQHTTVMHDTRVGDFVVLSCNSSIGDGSLIEDNVFIAGGCQVNGRVVVEEDAYIGSGAIISPCCRIGRRSVVGLNSTVTRNIPPESVCAGPSAKIVARETDQIMSHIDQSKSGERIMRDMTDR
tara:strand:- start:3975 stop:4679 length:705 start_codon:yes stop_codon:yes gene_type:complete